MLKELFGAVTRRAKAVEITMDLLKEGVGLLARWLLDLYMSRKTGGGSTEAKTRLF